MRKSIPLTAHEFFAKHCAGYTKSDAQLATRLAYSTINDAARDGAWPRPETLRKLEEWSRAAIAEHGYFISSERMFERAMEIAAEKASA
jgi:hypothetical protein